MMRRLGWLGCIYPTTLHIISNSSWYFPSDVVMLSKHRQGRAGCKGNVRNMYKDKECARNVAVKTNTQPDPLLSTNLTLGVAGGA